MNFLKKISQKKAIHNLFITSNTVYENVSSCLIPSTSVFYHYKFAYLGMTRSEQTITFETLENSFKDYSFYLNKYIEIYNKILSVVNQDNKLKNKFNKNIIDYQNNFIGLRFSLESLITSILTIPNYKQVPELMFIKRSLNTFEHKLYFTKKFENQTTQNSCLTF